MQLVGIDRDRPGGTDDVALIRDEAERQNDGNERDADADIGAARQVVDAELHDRARTDRDRRAEDDERLHQRGDRLGFAVAEAVILVGGLRREPDRVKSDEAREQIEPGVGERPEHRHRPGRRRRPRLQA
jgi:hypothetical protein